MIDLESIKKFVQEHPPKDLFMDLKVTKQTPSIGEDFKPAVRVDFSYGGYSSSVAFFETSFSNEFYSNIVTSNTSKLSKVLDNLSIKEGNVAPRVEGFAFEADETGPYKGRGYHTATGELEYKIVLQPPIPMKIRVVVWKKW